MVPDCGQVLPALWLHALPSPVQRLLVSPQQHLPGNTRTKEILADYSYSQLDSVSVDIVEEAITLKMKPRGPEDQKLFNFETIQKEDIANLIASYSPVHSNWQRVGEAKIKQVWHCVL